MNTRQLLMSAIAASTIVGAISLASAQSSTETTRPPAQTPSADTMTPPTPATQTPAPATSDTSTPAPAAASPDSSTAPAPMANEPAPKADRN